MMSDCEKSVWLFSDAMNRSVLLPSHDGRCASPLPLKADETVVTVEGEGAGAGAGAEKGQPVASARLGPLDAAMMVLIAAMIWCNLWMMDAPIAKPFVFVSDGTLTPILPISSLTVDAAH